MIWRLMNEGMKRRWENGRMGEWENGRTDFCKDMPWHVPTLQLLENVGPRHGVALRLLS